MSVSPKEHAYLVQAVYILTGCDYISYFKGIGKVFFLNVLFQHAAFITGGLDPPGCLAHLTSPENFHMGFLAFVRLVGCAYFKKQLSGFKFDTPEATFKSFTISSLDCHHQEWLELIRTIYILFGKEATMNRTIYHPMKLYTFIGGGVHG